MTSPPGGVGQFIFTNDIDGIDFVLGHGEMKTFAAVLAGKYKVSEVDPSPDHVLFGSDCDDDNSATALLTATVNLDRGETVTCTFTNAPKIQIPTAAELARLEADTTPTGRVDIRWETGSEASVLGFNLHRGTSREGPYTRVNRRLISNQGSATQGARYRMSDMPGIGGYYYKLELIGIDGAPELYGPVAVRVDALRAFLPLTRRR